MKKYLLHMAIAAGLCLALSGCGSSDSSSGNSSFFNPNTMADNVIYYKGNVPIKELKEAGFSPIEWNEKSVGAIYLTKEAFDRVSSNGFKSNVLVESFKNNYPLFIDGASESSEEKLCKILGIKYTDDNGIDDFNNALIGVMKNKTGGVSTFVHNKEEAGYESLLSSEPQKIAWIESGSARIFNLPCQGYDDPYMIVNDVLPIEENGKIVLKNSNGTNLEDSDGIIEPAIVIVKDGDNCETWLQSEGAPISLNYFKCEIDSADKALCKISEGDERIINFYLDGRNSEFLKKEPENHSGVCTADDNDNVEFCYTQMSDWVTSENQYIEENKELSKGINDFKDNVAELAAMNCITVANDLCGKNFVIKTYYCGVHAFSGNGGDDYMFFRQECMVDGSGGYQGPHWVGGASRNGECIDNYMKEWTVKTELLGDSLPDSFLALSPSPTAVNKQTEYSTSEKFGVSGGVTGGISSKGGASADASLSLDWGVSDSRTWSVNDVEVLSSIPSLGQAVSWTHKYETPHQNRSCGKWQRIYEGANLGHSLYTPVHMWLWKIPSSRRNINNTVKLYFELFVESMYTRNSGSISPGTKSQNGAVCHKANLIFPPTFALEKNELTVGKSSKAYKVGIGCETGYSINFNCSWATVTNDSSYIYISVNDNDTGSPRTAVVDVVSKDGDKRQLKITQLNAEF